MRQHAVGNSRQPSLHGRSIVCLEESAPPVCPPGIGRVECSHRVRLPLPAQDVGKGPLGDIGIVPAARVPGPGLQDCGAMDHINHPPGLRDELSLPLGRVEAVARREFGPDTMDQPQGAVGMRQVPAAEGAVELGRQDGVEADRVGIHPRHHSQPPGVKRRVAGKFRGKLPWKRGTEVDSLDPQPPPGAVAQNFEMAPPRSGAELQGRGARRRARLASPPFRILPVEHRDGCCVGGVPLYHPLRSRDGTASLSRPFPRQRQAGPGIEVG